MKRSLRLILCLFILLPAISCKKNKNVIDQATADENIITKYIADHQLNATATGSGLYYVITTQGTGAQPSASSVVTVNYKGYLTDGTVFDRSPAGGFVTSLTKVIQGWQEGIPLFKKGGKGMLLVPSALGYGSQATASIPASSVLIFDIELVDVN